MSWRDFERWVPITAPTTSGSLLRAAQHLVAVVAQFEVDTHPRYAAAEGKTYCNVFLWDVTRALACEIPHWWLGRELNANGMIDWLGGQGLNHGWYPVSQVDVVNRAAKGLPTVGTWRSKGDSPGHVAKVVPTPEHMQGIFSAQAGATNFSCERIENGFGALPIAYWGHL